MTHVRSGTALAATTAAGMAAFGSDFADLLLGAVGKVAGVGVLSHYGWLLV